MRGAVPIGVRWFGLALVASATVSAVALGRLLVTSPELDVAAVALFVVAVLVCLLAVVAVPRGGSEVRGWFQDRPGFWSLVGLMFVLEVPLLVLIRAALFGAGPPDEVVFFALFTAGFGSLLTAGLLRAATPRRPHRNDK